MIGDLAFMHGSHRPRCIATVDKRFPYHTLQLMMRGAVELFYDDQRYLMQGTWLWPCHPGPWIRFHEWPRNKSWDHRYLALTGPRVASWVADGLWPSEPMKLTPGLARRCAGWLDRALEDAQHGDRLRWLMAIHQIEKLLLELAKIRRDAQPVPEPWFAKVTRVLSESKASVDYAQLAEDHGMSLATLRRRFFAVTGQSLHQFRMTARLAQARQLLGDTDLPIKRVADQLGYCDVFYFTRQFTQFAGVSPLAYRKSRQR